jgi:tripartite ATP-independent transporter DctP family solute receptor
MNQITQGAALTAAILIAAPAAGQMQLNLGHGGALDAHYSVGAQAFAAHVEAELPGEFEIVENPASSLGNEREMIEGIQLGTVDLVITSTGPLGNFVRETLAFDVPFLFRDYDHARAVLDGEVGQEILDALPDHGMIGLTWMENGFRHVTNDVRPIRNLADMEGLEIRTMENPVHIEAFELLGANPTPMAWPELFTALQQKVVEGQETPITVIRMMNFNDVQSNISLTGHVYGPAILLMSPAVWDGLTDAQRQVFREAAQKAVEANRGFVDAKEAEDLAYLGENGMDVVSEFDRTGLDEALAPLYASMREEFGDLIDRIQAQ